jgi:hypothetical protein
MRVILIAAALLSFGTLLGACGGDDTVVTTTTVAPGDGGGGQDEDAAPARTGIAELDRIIADAVAGEQDAYIELAALTGYQRVNCVTGDSSEFVPQCRDTDEPGAEVEALPVVGCLPAWIRPEQVTDQYRESLPAGETDLLAVYEPAADTPVIRGGFGATSVLVFSTGTNSDGNPRGTALHIRDGRIVLVEPSCDNISELLAPERVEAYIIEPTPAAGDGGGEQPVD